MIKMFKRFTCVFISGHRWDQTHGYHDYPENGAICQRCGLIFIYEENNE